MLLCCAAVLCVYLFVLFFLLTPTTHHHPLSSTHTSHLCISIILVSSINKNTRRQQTCSIYFSFPHAHNTSTHVYTPLNPLALTLELSCAVYHRLTCCLTFDIFVPNTNSLIASSCSRMGRSQAHDVCVCPTSLFILSHLTPIVSVLIHACYCL